MTAMIRTLLFTATLLSVCVAGAAPPAHGDWTAQAKSRESEYEYYRSRQPQARHRADSFSSPAGNVGTASISLVSGTGRRGERRSESRAEKRTTKRSERRAAKPRPKLIKSGDRLDSAPRVPRSRSVIFSTPTEHYSESALLYIPSLRDDGRLVSFSAPSEVFTTANAVFEDAGTPRRLAQNNGTSPGRSQSTTGNEQKIGEAPAETNANIQFLRQDSVLLKPGEYQVDFTTQYLIDEVDFALAQTSGNNLVIGEARRRRRLLLSSVEFRLGVTSDVQAFVNLPVGISHSEFTFGGSNQFDDTSGLGDVSAGIIRSLYDGDGTTPQILATLAFSAPTGNTTFLSSLTTPGSNLGEGFWSVTAGLTMIHVYDPLVVFYGFGYRHRFETTIDDFFVEPGAQGFYRFGVGFAVNPKMTLSASLLGSYIGENKVNAVSIAGSVQEPIQLRLASTIVRGKADRFGSPVQTIEPFVTFGLTEDAIDTVIGISRTY